MILEKYLNELTTHYIYHYTEKKNVPVIEKYGLLSLYGQYHKTPQLFEKNIENYKERIENFSKKKDFSIEDVERFFESRGTSIKSLFFSFWKIIPGLNKDRDNFVRQSELIQIDIESLKPTWKYTLISGSKTAKININDIIKFTNMNSIDFQKKKSSKFMFSKIPHLSIETNDGIIPKNLLIIGNKS